MTLKKVFETINPKNICIFKNLYMHFNENGEMIFKMRNDSNVKIIDKSAAINFIKSNWHKMEQWQQNQADRIFGEII